MPTSILDSKRKIVDVKAEHREGTTGKLIWRYAHFEKPGPDASKEEQAYFGIRCRYETLRAKVCEYLRSVELPEWVRTGESPPTTAMKCTEGIAKLNLLLKTGGKSDGTIRSAN